jgi:hypothetical protein
VYPAQEAFSPGITERGERPVTTCYRVCQDLLKRRIISERIELSAF